MVFVFGVAALILAFLFFMESMLNIEYNLTIFFSLFFFWVATVSHHVSYLNHFTQKTRLDGLLQEYPWYRLVFLSN